MKPSLKITLAFIGLPLILLPGVVLLLTISPSSAANGANALRGIIGPGPVSAIESFVFTTEDQARQVLYQTGLMKAEAPWQPAGLSNPEVMTSVLPTRIPGKAAENKPDQPAKKGVLNLTDPSTTQAWVLPAIPSNGSIPGEGIWSPYIVDSSGQTIALRTFLVPDPKRPYAILSIVAFNLTYCQLHFVLGSIEPHTASFHLSGEIPAQDMTSGRLVAAFNGGFLAIHGEYGAMANGIIPLPPKDNLATVGIYPDGRIRIGKWGKDLSDADHLMAWRQNGPMIIYDGAVTPAVSSNTTAIWGGTIEGHVVTWRSGIAANQDNTVLYYFAGPAMDVGSMSKALLQIGAYQAMQLDINNFWVHFTAIQEQDGNLTAVPLVKAMFDKEDRFLKPYSRDFFYITVR